MTRNSGGGDAREEDMSREERIEEVRQARRGIPDDLEPGVAFSGEPLGLERGGGTAPTPPLFGSSDDGGDMPFSVLVCTDCREFHEHDGEWEVCPKCGEDLIEVDRA